MMREKPRALFRRRHKLSEAFRRRASDLIFEAYVHRLKVDADGRFFLTCSLVVSAVFTDEGAPAGMRSAMGTLRVSVERRLVVTYAAGLSAVPARARACGIARAGSFHP